MTIIWRSRTLRGLRSFNRRTPFDPDLVAEIAVFASSISAGEGLRLDPILNINHIPKPKTVRIAR
jgi:hypothetical protein